MNTHIQNPSELLSRFLTYIVTRHSTQYDKGGKPYALHPIAVMNLLDTADVELQIMALAHDVIEDSKYTKATWQELVDLGATPRIIAGLKLLTKLPGQTEEEYLSGILSSVDAMRVKACDIRHNSDMCRLKGITEKDLKRLGKYAVMYHTITTKLAEEGY